MKFKKRPARMIISIAALLHGLAALLQAILKAI
jgi:hypothetical protein